jgi:transcriptional regulator with XRE-family HTH domain
MTYATEHIASTLKNARRAKGLTQRGLGKSAAVPQSHVSKIENGAVDLRVSSLVELARVLDLELMLVPRKSVPAVQSIISGDTERTSFGNESARQAVRELRQLQDDVGELIKARPSAVELAQLAGQVRQLQFYRIPGQHLDTVRSIRKAVQISRDHSQSLDAVRDWLSQLGSLRNSLAHGLGGSGEGELSRPAYSLDEDQNG